MAAAAQKFGMFLCVQDLTCPGASLIHSAGIAARVPGNAGMKPTPVSSCLPPVPAGSAVSGVFTIRGGGCAGTIDRPGTGRGAAGSAADGR